MTTSNGSSILLTLGIIAIVGIATGLVFSILKTQQKAANKPAVLSLVFALAYFLVLATFLLFAKSLSQLPIINIILAIFGVPLAFAGIVLAIIGLTQISCQTGGKAIGRVQGIFGVCLNALLLAVLSIVAFVSLHLELLENYVEDHPDLISGTSIADTTENHELFANDIFLSSPTETYRIKIPNDNWSALPANELNNHAEIGLFSSKDSSQAYVIPTEIDPLTPIDLEELSQGIRNKLTETANGSSYTESIVETVSGVEGLRFNLEIPTSDSQTSHSTWVGLHNNHSYQLHTSVVDGDMKQAEDAGKLIASGFVFTPLDQPAKAETSLQKLHFDNPQLGIQVHLPASDWGKWTSLKTDAPEAFYGATIDDKAFFIIVPIIHQNLSVSFEDLKTAYLEHVFGQDSGYETTTNDKELTSQANGFNTHQVTFTYDMGDYKNHVISRIYQSAELSFMAATYISTDNFNTKIKHKMLNALDSVQLNSPSNLATGILAMSDSQKEFHGNTLNEIGLAAYNRNDYILAAQFFETAFVFDPNDPTLLGNILQTEDILQNYSQGIERYLKNEKRFKSNKNLRARYANFLSKTSKDQESAEIYSNLFENGHNDEDDLLDYLNVLIDLDQRLLAIDATKNFIKRTRSWKATRWLASMQSDEGQYDSAEATLQKLKKNRPFDSQIDYDFINLHYTSGALNKALAYYEELAPNIQGQTRFIALIGKVHYAKKDYNRAKQHFEKALQSNPNDEDIKSWLEYAANTMGKSDSDVLKDEIHPVELPEAIWEKLNANTESNIVSSKSRILSSIRAIEFIPEKSNKSTTYKRVIILDDAALETYKTLSFDYDPFAEEIFINKLQVTDEKGEIISTGNPEDYYVMDDAESSMATEDKTLHAPVPGLRKGSTLEYAITRKSHNSPDKIPFKRHFFANRLPSELIAIAVKADPLHYNFTGSSNLETISEDSTHLWLARDSAPYRWEPYQKEIDYFIPKIEIGDSQSNWQDIGDDYLDRITEKLELDKTTKSIATEITANLVSEQEKIFAIYRYIQQNFTYKAIEFGQRARIPNTSKQTIQNNYGDCKDLALLAHQLLKAVEIPSQLSLVHNSRLVNSNIPSMDQFNHMILFIPTLENGRFLDCTSRSASPKLLAPINMPGRHALLLQKERSNLVEIPKSQQNESLIQSQKDLKISENNILVKETLSIEGEYAAYFREYLLDTQPENLIKKMQGLMAQIESNVQLDALESFNLDDSLKALVLKLEYKIRNGIPINKAGEFELEIPSIWEQDYLDVQFMSDRRNPFELSSPFSFKSKVSIAMEGFSSGIKKSDWDQNSQSAFHNASSVLTNHTPGSSLEIEHEVKLLSGDHDASEFENFVISSKNALKPLVRPIILKPKNPNSKQ